jgi:hypothetical protein
VIDVEVRNRVAFDGMLTALQAGFGDMGGPVMAGAGTLIVAAARVGSPRRRGQMAARHSIALHGRNRLRITVDTDYAAPIHWGWPAHGIKRQPWVVATFNRDTAWMDRMEADAQKLIDQEAAKT